jgi:hypothetical protein
LVVGGDIEESIGFTPFRTDTNHLGTSSLSWNHLCSEESSYYKGTS